MWRSVLLAVVLAGLLAGCSGGLAGGGNGAASCAAILHWQGRTYWGMGTAIKPRDGGKLGSGQYPPCNDTGALVPGHRMWTSTGSQASRQARPFRPTGSSSFGTRRGYQQRYRRLFTHRSARAKPAARLWRCGVGLTRSTVRRLMVISASRRMAWSCSSEVGLPGFVAPRSPPGFPTRPMASY